MKLTEAIKRHPRTLAFTTALLLGAGAVEALGWAQNPTYDVPAGSCTSPFAASSTYVDRGANLLFQTQAGFFTTGVVARGQLPQDAYGLQASFKSPDADVAAWETNASRMLSANDVGQFALKLAIGPGDVQFGVRVVAPANSPLCDTAPRVTFTHESAGGYFRAPGDLPWPNIASVAVNVF